MNIEFAIMMRNSWQWITYHEKNYSMNVELVVGWLTEYGCLYKTIKRIPWFPIEIVLSDDSKNEWCPDRLSLEGKRSRTRSPVPPPLRDEHRG